MSFWIFIWIILSLFILGVFFWSLDVLFKQKKAWERFAKSKGLAYRRGPFYSSPVVEGRINGHYLTLYSEEQTLATARSKRFRTVAAITLSSPMPCGGLIASPSLQDFAQSLNLTEDVDVNYTGWDSARIVRSKNKEVLNKYLKDERRLKALNSLMKSKTTSLLFIFDEQEAILRVETPNPLHEYARLEKILNAIITAADLLILSDREKADIVADKPQASEKEPEKELVKD